jgi:hypothetical protein
MRLVPVTAIALLTATVAFGDATIDQKTQFHFSGAMSIVNVFGGKATHEGAESTVIIHGDRKLSRTGSTGELVDLAAEKVYRLDFDRKTYKVVTFDEMRKQWEEQKAKAAKGSKDTAKNDGPEYEVDFDVKSTGQKQAINGYNTHEEVVTVAVHEKGKKLEQSGGWVLTADMWMGPKIAALREQADFDRRYFQKLYGGSFAGADMQAMMTAMAQTPAFGKAMKAFADKRSSFDGTPVRTNLAFEIVGAPGGSNESADRDSSQPTNAAAVIGGLFGKIQKKRQAESSDSKDPNRSKMFDSTTELLRATGSASAADVALPADFKQK